MDTEPLAPLLPKRRDQVNSLVKALQLLESFDSAHTRMTLSQAAVRVGISPASARRSLLTLCAAGYMQTDGKLFWLGHGALRIAHAYAASTRLPRLLQPALDALCERTRESATLSVLDGVDVVIAARATARRTLRVGLTLGAHLPLHCSAAGRALLADMAPARARALLEQAEREALTRHTVVDLEQLSALLAQCQSSGYATCDEEIELGVRSIAIPIVDAQGATVAALSVSTRAERMGIQDMVERCLPEMLRNRDWARSRMG